MKTSTPSPNPNTVLFGAELALASLNDGTAVPVRVVVVPTRNRIAMFDLFERSQNAQVLERSVQINHGTEVQTNWQPVAPEWVDSLDDDSHSRLFELSKKLNFQRAITAAEGVIAMGTELLPMQQRFTMTAMKPIRDELTSLMSSLTAQFSAASVAKQP